eukprot:1193230-Prorocentrum_minimum.AAC.6
MSLRFVVRLATTVGSPCQRRGCEHLTDPEERGRTPAVHTGCRMGGSIYLWCGPMTSGERACT